jgi:rifampin ADP-ribosylating transferase
MTEVLDEGPFFHGTIADLRVGDLLTAGYRSNYRPEVVMNHIYFTAIVDGAGLAAEIAAELTKGGAVPRVYVVEPTGIFENDPNVTDKKFPGNPTRSYRSSAPLKVIGEITHWTRLTAGMETTTDRAALRRTRRNHQLIRGGNSRRVSTPSKKTISFPP